MKLVLIKFLCLLFFVLAFQFLHGNSFAQTPTPCRSFSSVRTFSYNTATNPWWQTVDGDVHAGVVPAQGNITSLIASCADEKYLSLKRSVEGMPGVVSYGNSLTIPDQTSVSENNWQAKTAYTAAQIGYDYLINKLNVDTSNKLTTLDVDLAEVIAQKDNGIYYWDKSGQYLAGANVPNGKKYIIFVNGDVTVSSDITVDSGGFFALISKGNIDFGVNVKEAHGFYLTDGILTVKKKASGADHQFTGEGSFVGWGGVSLPRNLGNNCRPAEVFTLRPDLYINAPAEFQYSPSFFQEVAP